MRSIFYLSVIVSNTVLSFPAAKFRHCIRMMSSSTSDTNTLHAMPTASSQISNRILNTERPYIEDVLDKYMSIPDITALALGSSHWQPPHEALTRLTDDLHVRDTQRYGNIEGYKPLQNAWQEDLEGRGLSFDGADIVVTSGANQAFVNICMLLMDNNDNAGNYRYAKTRNNLNLSYYICSDLGSILLQS